MERISYNETPPEIYTQLLKVNKMIDDSKISFNLLELIRLRVAQINNCAYCVDMHYKILKKLGESELRLSSLCIWRDCPYYTEPENCVLNYAEHILGKATASKQEKDIIMPLFKHFNKSEVSFLALAVGQINSWTVLMKTFNTTPGNYVAK